MPNGYYNPQNICEWCNISASEDSWSDNNGQACDDGLFCTTGDVCDEGVCDGAPRNCSDGVDCNGTETCNEAGNTCQNGTPTCGDEEYCDAVADACISTCPG